MRARGTPGWRHTGWARASRCLHGDQRGATMVEYGFMLFFIALVAVTGISLFGTQVADLFTNVGPFGGGGGGP